MILKPPPFLVFFGAVFLTSCATSQVQTPETSIKTTAATPVTSESISAPESADPELSPKAVEALEKMISTVEAEVNEAPEGEDISDLDDDSNDVELPKNSTVPVEMNRLVRKWVKYFSGKDRERFQRFLLRGEKYKSVVQTILKENGIPVDLYYLAMIESGYSTHAASHASAVGAWQFIRGTAVRYDLEVNHFLDERRDPIRATEAAAKYLTDLYNAFQDWYLAMAAYNAGEYRILGAIIRAKSRDYWTLVNKRALPAETRDYVPKFLAAVIIGHQPEKFGFSLEGAEEYPSVEKVEVASPVRLSDIARMSGIPLEDLKEVNPHIKKGVTSPNQSTYEVWVPSEKVSLVEKAKTQLASQKVRGLRPTTRLIAREDSGSAGSSRVTHQVRRGENLSIIARKYRISTNYLRRINGGSSSIYPGQVLRLTARSYVKAPVSRKSGTYQVRRGDTLHRIARRFGLSINVLKRKNGLASNRVYVGQKLQVN